MHVIDEELSHEAGVRLDGRSHELQLNQRVIRRSALRLH